MYAILKRCENLRLKLDSMRLKTPSEIIEENYQRVDNLVKHMENRIMLNISEGKRLLASSAAKLDALSPLQTLSRGFSVAITNDGTVVRSSKDLHSGDDFTLKLTDGDVDCFVK